MSYEMTGWMNIPRVTDISAHDVTVC